MDAHSGEADGYTSAAEITPDPLSDDFLSWVKLTTARPGTWPSVEGTSLADEKHWDSDINLLSSYADREQRALRLAANREKKTQQSYEKALEAARAAEERCQKKVTFHIVS